MNDFGQFVEVPFFVWNFHDKKWVLSSLTSFGTLKNDCVIKTREIFNFLPNKQLGYYWI